MLLHDSGMHADPSMTAENRRESGAEGKRESRRRSCSETLDENAVLAASCIACVVILLALPLPHHLLQFSSPSCLAVSFRSVCCYCFAFLASLLAAFGQKPRGNRARDQGPGPSSYFVGFKSASFCFGSTCFDRQRFVGFSFALVALNLTHSSHHLSHFPVSSFTSPPSPSLHSLLTLIFHLILFRPVMIYDQQHRMRFGYSFLSPFSFFWWKLSPLLFSFRFDFVCVLSQMICCST